MNATDRIEPSSLHTVAEELAVIIKKNKFSRPSLGVLQKLSEFPHKILQIYGINNLTLLNKLLSSKVSDKHLEIKEDFIEFIRDYFMNFCQGTNLTPSRASRLGSKSSFFSRGSSLSLRTQVLFGFKNYLELHPFPYELACHYRMYKFQPRRDEGESPFAFAGRIQDKRVRIIDEIYRILGPKPASDPLYFSLHLGEVLDREMVILKCRASPYESSWRACIEEWSKEWGKENPEIVRLAQELLGLYHLTPLLIASHEVTKKSAEDFTLKLSIDIDKEDSFCEFMHSKTIWEVISDLLNDRFVDLQKFLFSSFRDVIKNESVRQTLIFFMSVITQEYKKIPKVEIRNFSYIPYKNILQKQLKLIKHLTHNYSQSKPSYQLSEEAQELYELLLSCLLMMHFSQLFTKCSTEDKLQIFIGILKMDPWEKKTLYEDSLLQIPIETNQKYDLSKILSEYTFSDQRTAFLMIKIQLFHLGLRTELFEPTHGTSVGNYQPMNLRDCYRFFEKIAQFSRGDIPEDTFFYGLLWQYIDREEKNILNNMSIVRKIIVQRHLQKFFIPCDIIEQVKICFSTILRKYSFPKYADPSARQSVSRLNDCLSYAILSECFPKNYLPFVFTMFNSNDLSFESLKNWGVQNCCVLRELSLNSRAVWIDAYWKDHEIEEYFYLNFVFLSSLRSPESCQLKVCLKITRRRLERDAILQQLLRMLLPYFCDDFQHSYNNTPQAQAFTCLEEILPYYDESIQLFWDDYQAEDKQEISQSLYQFFYDLKIGTRKKILKLALPVNSIEPKGIADGNVYASNGVFSLVPGSVEPKEVIHVEIYREKAFRLIRRLSEKESFVLKNFLSIDLKFPSHVSVEYNLKQLTMRIFEKEYLLEFEHRESFFAHGKSKDQPKESLEEKNIEKESQPKLKKRAKGKEKESLSELEEKSKGEENESLSDSSVEDLGMYLHYELIFYLTNDPSIIFTVIYPTIPTPELICWQLAVLKSKYYEKHPPQEL